MIRDAITCDTEGCIALLIEPLVYGGDSFEDYTEIQGWTYGDTGHACPPCMAGSGIVLERGECPRCGGRECLQPGGSLCLYCKHETPHVDTLDDFDTLSWGEQMRHHCESNAEYTRKLGLLPVSESEAQEAVDEIIGQDHLDRVTREDC